MIWAEWIRALLGDEAAEDYLRTQAQMFEQRMAPRPTMSIAEQMHANDTLCILDTTRWARTAETEGDE